MRRGIARASLGPGPGVPRRWSTGLWPAGLALVLLACGGATSPPPAAAPAPPPPPRPVSAQGASEVRADVTTAGGTLALADGVRLEIPGGALVHTAEVVLSHGAEGRAFADAERQRPLGPMITIVPSLVAAEGRHFTVSIPAQPIPNGFEVTDLALGMEEVDDQQRAIGTLSTQTRWQFYPVRIENGRWVADVGGLHGHRLHFGVAR